MHKGVAVILAINITTMLTKPGFVGPAGLAIIDAVAAAAGDLIDVRGGELVRWASNGYDVPYFHTASWYDGHLVADKPLDLVE